MTQNEKSTKEDFLRRIIITPEMTVIECLKRLETTGYHTLVCLVNNRVSGVLSEGDIRRGLLGGSGLDAFIAPLVNTNPVTITMPYDTGETLALMRSKRIDAVPLVDAQMHLLDILRISDLLQARALPNTAVIMAGGIGKRLQPLTLKTPKPLLPIGDRSMIEHIIGHLAQEGIRRIVISVNYKAEQFEATLGRGDHLGVEISYVHENRPMGTLGALGLVGEAHREHPLLITNGDVLSSLNIRDLFGFHQSQKADLTLCVKEHSYRVPYGVVRVDDNRIVEIDEKPEHGFLVSSGICCIQPEAAAMVAKDVPLDVPTFIHHLADNGRRVSAFQFSGYWRDVGNLADYSRANVERSGSNEGRED